MALTVRATVVDIQHDTPKDTDHFIVDTNAWLFLFYPPASAPGTPPLPQATHYPAYIKKALSAKSTLYALALSFPEIAHAIERGERAKHEAIAGQVQTKDFRHNYPNKRLKIVNEIRDTWNAVTQYTQLLDMKLDSNFLVSALQLFPSVGLDGYDTFFVEQALQSGHTQIISDDKDYLTVSNITVFTANQNAIQAAAAANKLLTRP